MIVLQINRNELQNGIHDITDMIAEAIKADLGAKKVTVRCNSKYWQGDTDPDFSATADGIKLFVMGHVSPFDLEADPWNYELDIDYVLLD